MLQKCTGRLPEDANPGGSGKPPCTLECTGRLPVFFICSDGPKFTIQVTTFPKKSIQTEAIKLLSEITSMVKFHKYIPFFQVYGDEKIIKWLRSHLSLLMITIRIWPKFGIKYINQWLTDAYRFDPHNTVIVTNPSCGNKSLLFICRHKFCSFERHLKSLKFLDHAAEQFRHYLKKAPNHDPLSCLSSLSLSLKHLLINCMLTDIIPHILHFF